MQWIWLRKTIPMPLQDSSRSEKDVMRWADGLQNEWTMFCQRAGTVVPTVRRHMMGECLKQSSFALQRARSSGTFAEQETLINGHSHEWFYRIRARYPGLCCQTSLIGTLSNSSFIHHSANPRIAQYRHHSHPHHISTQISPSSSAPLPTCRSTSSSSPCSLHCRRLLLE